MKDNSLEKNFTNESEKQAEYAEAERETEIAPQTEKKEALEGREMAPQVERGEERDRLMRQVKQAKLTPEEEAEAKKETVKIKKMDSHGKLQRLLTIAKDKGVVFAIKVARDLGDPYALDMLHDILAQDENYKKLQ